MAVLKSKKLADKVKENVSIERKVGSNEPFEKKQGKPLDMTQKTQPNSRAIVGMSKGITKNMGDYESLRVDVWLSDEVQEKETPEEAVKRIESFIDKALETAIANTVGE